LSAVLHQRDHMAAEGGGGEIARRGKKKEK
jgi:hypothetical protein